MHLHSPPAPSSGRGTARPPPCGTPTAEAAAAGGGAVQWLEEESGRSSSPPPHLVSLLALLLELLLQRRLALLDGGLHCLVVNGAGGRRPRATGLRSGRLGGRLQRPHFSSQLLDHLLLLRGATGASGGRRLGSCGSSSGSRSCSCGCRPIAGARGPPGSAPCRRRHGGASATAPCPGVLHSLKFYRPARCCWRAGLRRVSELDVIVVGRRLVCVRVLGRRDSSGGGGGGRARRGGPGWRRAPRAALLPLRLLDARLVLQLRL